jgi:tight adherence protein B
MDSNTQIILASICSGLSILLLTLVIVEFFAYTSKTYKERYIKEAAVELDDVLLQMPPGRILDLSLALSALASFIGIAALALYSSNWSWPKAIFIGLACGIGAFPTPRLYLKHKKKARLILFNEQLEDALTSMSSALRSGFSINQAIEVVAQENRRPVSVEFRLLMQEIRLGVSLEEALQKMVDRLESEDFELVATAIITARQTGGELTAIFQRLAGVIRERTRIQGRLRSMTAQGRLQAYVVGAMPFLLMLAMNFVAPDMMSVFFNSVIGIAIMAGVCIMVLIGFLIIKKITNIDI